MHELADDLQLLHGFLPEFYPFSRVIFDMPVSDEIFIRGEASISYSLRGMLVEYLLS